MPRVPVLVCLVLLAAGCRPTICYFHAEPNVVCGGSSAELSWAASTGGNIVDETNKGVISAVPRTGTTKVSPSAPTTYRLDVSSHWGKKSQEAFVGVVAAPALKRIGGSIAEMTTTCTDGVLSVTFDAPSRYWDPHVLAGVVAGLGHRALVVEHLGIRADLGIDATTTAFGQVPAVGVWKISTTLLPGEACGSKVPRILALDLTPTCSP